uniref:Trypsin inhibitor n=1 Tax=Leucaena leucocephala TaxID=3866 RepID=ITRY_LEULE|nr:RecName: Full=Trypsin inhibitor; Short=LTI; Short=LlTI; AltName: Full=Kunitz-type trypsin inhibitor LlTI; Contains: RecName: Full=Trypsin inhibitor alpha chain; Contains: RecName: Full=Trypsin inhibitor beta chain [Leucaena leucocephala]
QVLVDLDGDPLYNGMSYYILPVARGKGGGLELARTGSESCPRTVVQTRSETSRGLPARLASPYRILIGSNIPLTIEFQPQKPYSCHGHSSRSLQWKVEKTQMVKIASSDEEQRLFGPFQIQPYRNHYKLVYCESESRNHHDDCRDLGISIDDQQNRLLVVKNGDPLVVQFAKANRGGDD